MLPAQQGSAKCEQKNIGDKAGKRVLFSQLHQAGIDIFAVQSLWNSVHLYSQFHQLTLQQYVKLCQGVCSDDFCSVCVFKKKKRFSLFLNTAKFLFLFLILTGIYLPDLHDLSLQRMYVIFLPISSLYRLANNFWITRT